MIEMVFSSSLEEVEQSLNDLLSAVRRAKIKFIRRQTIQRSARDITTAWFEKIDPYLESYGISLSAKEDYAKLFRRLLGLSTKGSQSSQYTGLIDDILKNFHDDILIPALRYSKTGVDLTVIGKIVSSATAEERDYLDEAVGCAKENYLRAATILTWCAAVHRMHKVIEKIGFDVFSAKSLEMKNIKSGRYKRFNKFFEIHSMTELQMVFDNDLLWVLEYMQLLDKNQQDRLEICFTMRNNSGHPGEAKITEPNFQSFCSDVYEFVFANPKFILP